MEAQQLTDLIQLVTRGDADALQRLLMHYHPALRARVAAALPAAGAHRLDADDVLQLAYIAAFKAFQSTAVRPGRTLRFDTPAAFYKWLERIALNELKNRRRDLRRQRRDVAREIVPPAASGTSYPDLLARLSGSGQTPSRQLAAQEATAAVLSGLARLTDDQRRVVQLRFLQGLPVAAVAARLGKSEDAVHALCYRGLKELRGMLGSLTNWL